MNGYVGVLTVGVIALLVLSPVCMASLPQSPSESIELDIQWAVGVRSIAYTPMLSAGADLGDLALAGEVHISKGTLDGIDYFSGPRSYVMTMLGASARHSLDHPSWLPIDPYLGMRVFYLRVWLGPESSPFPILASCENLPVDICGKSGSLETVGFGPLVGVNIPLLQLIGVPLQTQLDLALTALPNPVSPPFEPMGIRFGFGLLYQF